MKKGDKYQDSSGEIYGSHPFTIMGIVDDWVVMRRKGAAPTLAHINSFGENKEYKKVEQ